LTVDIRKSDAGRPASVMYYSHDTYGLGHLRRTLTLARFLPTVHRLVSQLIVTGSPLAHRFQLPPQTDYIKLPSVLKIGFDRYEARHLQVPFSWVRNARKDILLSAARHVRPELLVVDNVPCGLKGELLPALRYLNEQGCRLVLGLRDVVDEADWVRQAWERDRCFEAIDELYDRILVYGRRDVYDLAHEYGFSPDAEARTRYVGYLRRDAPTRGPQELKAEHGLTGDRLVLVMAGGGGDGYELLASVVHAMRAAGEQRRYDCVLLGGPLMPPDHRKRVLEMVASDRRIRYVDFVDDVASYVAAADAIVSMGGYNSVCELLTAGKPAIVVPRIKPRREQLIRAEALSHLGHLRLVHPDDLTPQRMLAEIEAVIDSPFPTARPMPLDGLPGAAAALDELLTDARETVVA
jgi:predicted glycosyltransferase